MSAAAGAEGAHRRVQKGNEGKAAIAALHMPLSSLTAENQRFKDHGAKKKSARNLLKSKKTVPEACILATSTYLQGAATS